MKRHKPQGPQPASAAVPPAPKPQVARVRLAAAAPLLKRFARVAREGGHPADEREVIGGPSRLRPVAN